MSRRRLWRSRLAVIAGTFYSTAIAGNWKVERRSRAIPPFQTCLHAVACKCVPAVPGVIRLSPGTSTSPRRARAPLGGASPLKGEKGDRPWPLRTCMYSPSTGREIYGIRPMVLALAGYGLPCRDSASSAVRMPRSPRGITASGMAASPRWLPASPGRPEKYRVWITRQDLP